MQPDSFKKFGNAYMDVGLIESVTFEEAGNIQSNRSLKANVIINFRSGHGLKLVEGEGYEEFKAYWFDVVMRW